MKYGNGIQRIFSSLAFIALSVALFTTAGCRSHPPAGTSAGRVPIGTSTPGEASSGLMRSDDLIEASEQVATALSEDVSEMALRDFGGKLITVTFGDLVNKTSRMPTTDFEFLRDRIKSRLMDSRFVRANIRFVENRARREALRNRELGQYAGRAAGAGAGSTPDIETFAFLNGNMYSVDRPGTRLYYLKFELMRADDGQTVFSKDYEVKYIQLGR